MVSEVSPPPQGPRGEYTAMVNDSPFQPKWPRLRNHRTRRPATRGAAHLEVMGTMTPRNALSLTAAAFLVFFFAGCGRSELDSPPEDVPDVDVPVDVPDDNPDTPDVLPPCSSSAACDDGRFCNGREQCLNGQCSPGVPLNCDDGVDCTTDQCDDAAQACRNSPDASRCMGGSCDPMRGCSNVQCRFDAECDNGDICDGSERCAGGRCLRGTPMICDDGVDCTVDVCQPGGGCLSRPDDRICDDGSFCNGQEL